MITFKYFEKIYGNIAQKNFKETSITLNSYQSDKPMSAPTAAIHVTENDILAIIKTLDPNKAHGCDNISIKDL